MCPCPARATPERLFGEVLKCAVPKADTAGMRHLSREESQSGSYGLWRYSPHRALVALGTILIVVAVAGGMLGVGNATRAERSDALLTERYLVVLPAGRQARASLENFQVLAEQAFEGSRVSATLLASAVQDSAAASQAYDALHRLLILPINAGLAPGLAGLESTYVGSQTVWPHSWQADAHHPRRRMPPWSSRLPTPTSTPLLLHYRRPSPTP
jgi:hypothetical protein